MKPEEVLRHTEEAKALGCEYVESKPRYYVTEDGSDILEYPLSVYGFHSEEECLKEWKAWYDDYSSRLDDFAYRKERYNHELIKWDIECEIKTEVVRELVS